MSRLKIAICFFFGLVACGENSTDLQDNLELGDVTSYNFDDLKELFSQGEYSKLTQVVRLRDKDKKVPADELLLAADAYIHLLDGISAEVTVEKSRFRGALQSKTAIPMARALILQGRLKDAKSELVTVSLSGFEGYQSYFIQGEIAQAEDDWESARRFYRLADGIQPNGVDIAVALALMDFAEGKFEEAKKKSLEALANNPDNPNLLYIVGAVVRQNGDKKMAIDYFLKVLALDPSHMFAQLELVGAYLDIGDVDGANQVLDVVLAEYPSQALGHFYVAYIKAQEEQLIEAEEILVRMERFLSTYIPAARLYGLITFKLNKYDLAAKYLQLTLEARPSDRQVRLSLADSYRKTGREEKALQVLEPLLNDANTDPAAFAQAGAANAALGRYNQASELLSLAARRPSEDKVDLKAKLVSQQAKMEFASGRREEAVLLLQDFTHDNEVPLSVLLTLCNMQIEVSKFSEALLTAKKMEAMNEDLSIVGNLRGIIAQRQGQFEEAITSFSNVLELQPDYFSALKNRASAYMALERFNVAKNDLLRLSQLAPSDGQVKGMLGISYMELGESGAAMRVLREARLAIPDSAKFAAYYSFALAREGFFVEAIKEARIAQNLAPIGSPIKIQLQNQIAQYKDAAERSARGG